LELLVLVQNDGGGGGGDEEMKISPNFLFLTSGWTCGAPMLVGGRFNKFDVADDDEDMKISPKI
jgi:hypothetical protein